MCPFHTISTRIITKRTCIGNYVFHCSISFQENRRQDFPLYHGVFPLETSLPTLGCIGGCLVNQASPPALEMQARWAAQVLAGKCRLPHPDVRKEMWKAKKRVYDKQGNNKVRHGDVYAIDSLCVKRIITIS